MMHPMTALPTWHRMLGTVLCLCRKLFLFSRQSFLDPFPDLSPWSSFSFFQHCPSRIQTIAENPMLTCPDVPLSIVVGCDDSRADEGRQQHGVVASLLQLYGHDGVCAKLGMKPLWRQGSIKRCVSALVARHWGKPSVPNVERWRSWALDHVQAIYKESTYDYARTMRWWFSDSVCLRRAKSLRMRSRRSRSRCRNWDEIGNREISVLETHNTKISFLEHASCGI